MWSLPPIVPVLVLCLGGLCAALAHTMILPIQGDLPRLLDTSVSSASWVLTSYLIAGAVTMPIAGRLADLYGQHRMMLVFAVMLVVGSMICALTSALPLLLVGRVLQGLSAGFMAIAFAVLREITPPRMTGPAIAALSAMLGLGGAIGLPLAAWIADDVEWHVLFVVVAVLGAVVAVAVALVVPRVNSRHRGSVDAIGAVGLTLGVVLLLIAVSKGTTWGWASSKVLGCSVIGVLVLVMWIRHELRHASPLVDLRTTRHLPVLLTNAAAVTISFGALAQFVVMPQLLVLPESTGHGLGQSAIAAGLWMAPSGVMMLAAAILASRLDDRLGPSWTLAIASTVLGAGYLFALVLMDSPWYLMIASCVASAGVSIGYAVMPVLLIQHMPHDQVGAGIGLNLLLRSVGTAIASAAMATVLAGSTTRVDNVDVPTAGAFQVCLLLGVLASVVGMGLSVMALRGKGSGPTRRGAGALTPSGRVARLTRPTE